MNVNCSHIHRALLAGEPVAGPGMEAHLADCPPCGALVADRGALAQRLGEPSSTQGLAALQGRLSARLARERGPVAWLRSRPTPLRVALALGFLALLSALFTVLSARPDMGLYPMPRMAFVLAVLAALAGAAAVQALQPLHMRALRTSEWTGWLAVALAIPFVLAVLPQAHSLHPASLAGMGADFLGRAGRCFTFGMEVGTPVLLLMVGLSRAPTRPGTALLAAALAGVTGNVVLQLDCPVTHPSHLLLGHATVGLGFAALTWAAMTVRGRFTAASSR